MGDEDLTGQEEIERLRAELAEWRRRAEVAEAVAEERLARAETAERALRAAEAAVSRRPAVPGGPGDVPGEEGAAPPRRPASLLERWRRYTETIN